MLLLIEWIAVVFYTVSVILTIRKNVWFWPTGIVGVGGFMLLFFVEKLYADMALQAVYLLQSVYGWYFWEKNKNASSTVSIQQLSRSQVLLAGITMIVFTLVVYWFLKTFTDASAPWWDSLATGLSLLAMWLLARKKLENWMVWIAADIVYIGLFYYKELYVSCALYCLFLILSIAGLVKWKKEMLVEKVSF